MDTALHRRRASFALQRRREVKNDPVKTLADIFTTFKHGRRQQKKGGEGWVGKQKKDESCDLVRGREKAGGRREGAKAVSVSKSQQVNHTIQLQFFYN